MIIIIRKWYFRVPENSTWLCPAARLTLTNCIIWLLACLLCWLMSCVVLLCPVACLFLYNTTIYGVIQHDIIRRKFRGPPQWGPSQTM